MDNNAQQRWLSRRELADRLGLPVRTLEKWAWKGTGPRYARMGRHVRSRVSDIVEWEAARVGDRCESAGCVGPMDRTTEQVADVASQDAHEGTVWSAR